MTDNNSDTADENVDKKTGQEPVTSKEDKSTASPTVAQDDVKNLVSQRDANFEKARTLEERLEAIEAEKERDDYIDTFLKENGKDYKYVERDDLLSATSPDEVKATAKRIQAKAEKIEQKALENIKQVEVPAPLTGNEKTERLEKLRKEADEGSTDAFGKMLDLEWSGGK